MVPQKSGESGAHHERPNWNLLRSLIRAVPNGFQLSILARQLGDLGRSGKGFGGIVYRRKTEAVRLVISRNLSGHAITDTMSRTCKPSASSPVISMLGNCRRVTSRLRRFVTTFQAVS